MIQALNESSWDINVLIVILAHIRQSFRKPGGLLTILKVKEEASQVLNERGDPLLKALWRKPPKMAFKNEIHFVADGSFTADGGLL